MYYYKELDYEEAERRYPALVKLADRVCAFVCDDLLGWQPNVRLLESCDEEHATYSTKTAEYGHAKRDFCNYVWVRADIGERLFVETLLHECKHCEQFRAMSTLSNTEVFLRKSTNEREAEEYGLAAARRFFASEAADLAIAARPVIEHKQFDVSAQSFVGELLGLADVLKIEPGSAKGAKEISSWPEVIDRVGQMRELLAA
jgi:hypothetical protein